MFNKILIANRGEIAVRVIRTAKALGYQTVAVFSEADADAPHVSAADEGVCIGAAAVGESYLVIDKIIDAAKRTGAGAVHPGYGFLSENCAFAAACQNEDIVFIGPPSSAIELMGSKRLSKIAMLKAGVPCIPGYEGEDQSIENLVVQSKEIGFPLMVKASAGGGGRGMRLVFEASELEAQIKTARSEAENAFGSGELILERAVIEPRHIEIQVFADQHGNAVYLGERDCSIQRRHQKVVEEAPSPFVDSELRQRMGEAAVQAAKACNYVGAGTVEFLVDADKNFYFLEMNTRLQVEHPVTELVTGTDLVAWQIDVAAGAALPLTQDEIKLTGHAMEVRLYAEDARNQFLPQTGLIELWEEVSGPGLRIDSGIKTGQSVSPFYDPMLAKLIAYGRNREEARRRLVQLVKNSTLFGVTVNAHFLCEVLQNQVFIDGDATTAFIEKDFGNNKSLLTQAPSLLSMGLACIVLHRAQQAHQDCANELSGWTNSASGLWPYELGLNETRWALRLSEQNKAYVIHDDNDTLQIDLLDETASSLTFICNGIRQTAKKLNKQGKVFLRLGSEDFQFEDATHQRSVAEEAQGSGLVKASMDGAIVDVLARVGEKVAKGETLVILEAMKMEHPLKADVNGTIKAVNTEAGSQVKLRQLLVEIETDIDE